MSATAARRARAATAVAVALMVAIQLVGADLVTAAAPVGLVTLQGVVDPMDAAAVIASWDGPLRMAALRVHALDLLLPLAYGTATWSAGTALALGRAAGTPVAVLAARAGRAGVAAAVLDQVENAAMAVALLAAPTTATGAVTVVSAVGKWALLALSLVGLAVAGWRALRPGRA